MRPVHVVVLLLSGALGGAMIMKVVHPGKPIVPAMVVAQAQPPATAPPEQPAPAPEPLAQALPAAEPEPQPVVAAEPAKPSPMPRVKLEIAPLPRVHTVAALQPEPVPVAPAPAEGYRIEHQPGTAQPEPVPAAPAPARAHTVAALQPEPVPAAAGPTQYPVPAPVPAPPATSPAMAPAPVSPPTSPEVSAAPVPQPHQVTLNAGYVLPVRLVDGLSSERNAPGDTFVATLDKEVVADGFVIAERGARVEGRVVAVDRAKVRAAAALALELTALHTSDGQTVAIETEGFFKHANAAQVNNTTKIAGGAILGSAIGALAGGGKGAAIGAGVGGGAGVGDVLLTRRPVELASETLVTFTLKTPVPLTEQLR